MLKNYLTIAVRNLFRQKLYSAINILGLAVGMACSILILIYVQDELSYDRYHKNADRIYRIVREQDFGGRVSHSAISPPAMAALLPDELPEVEGAVRLIPGGTLISYGEKRFFEDFYYADPGVFDVFNFPLLRGDPKTALSEPFSIVIAPAVAERFFGDEDPIGKVLTFSYQHHEYKVTGILKEVPRNSHIRFDALVSWVGYNEERNRNRWLPSYSSGSMMLLYSYVLLPQGYDPAELEEKLPGFVETYMGEHLRSRGWKLRFHLQPLTRIHLHSDLEHDRASVSSIAYVYGFSAIAVFILLIACVNFMNLSTARSARRAKEVGLRKTVGAHRWQLVGQFLGESVLVTVLAFVLAIALVELFLPAFSAIAGKELTAYHGTWFMPIALAAIPLAVGVIAGGYPAFFLSTFEPGDVLKGALSSGRRRSSFRKVLVAVQFAITTALLIGTGIVYTQMAYVRNKDLGVEKDHVVSVWCRAKEKFDLIKNEWSQEPGILETAASSDIPFRLPVGYNLPRWPVAPEGTPPDAALDISTYWIDYDFIRLFGIKVVAGRNFSKERFSADSTGAFIVNESAVKRFGWGTPEAAVGKQLTLLNRNNKGIRKAGRVIGVVRDFHMQVLYRKIEPAVFHMSTDRFECISARVAPGRMPDALAFLKQKTKALRPDRPFDYYILDERFESQYRADERRGQILGGFTVLAIFIACLGLFGLASFAAEQRTKEIGIRKILGAPVSHIALLLSKDFIKPVILANLIAWPVAYYAMNRWLQHFAYRIDLDIGIFALGGVLALAIALATVSYQAVKAALANPVDALRYE